MIKKMFFIFIVLTTVQVFSRQLTWSDAVQLTQKNSLDYQIIEKNFEAVDALETGSKSGFLPHLSVSVADTQTQIENQNSFQQYSRQYAAQLNLSQNIFAGFGDFYRNRLAQANTRSARAQQQSKFADLSLELKQAFADLVYAQNYKKLSEDIVQRRKDNLKNVQLQFQSGRENKGSLLLSEAYVEQSNLDDLSSRHEQEIAIENLRRILGLEATEDLVIEASVFTSTDLMASPKFEMIAINHPDVLMAQADEVVQSSTANISQAAFLPSLDLNTSYGYFDSEFFPQHKRWSVGLTLTWTLFDGFKDYASYQSNSFKYKASHLQYQSQFAKTLAHLKSAYNDYQEAIQKLKTDESFNKAAEVRALIARSKYKNGLMSFDDWDIVETDFIQRQKNVVTSRRDRVIKEAQWEQAQGLGVFNEKK